MESTDIIVLTIFSTLNNVSVYSVYYLVISGVKSLFMSLTDGIGALIGRLWAKGDKAVLRSYFLWMEWTMHTGAVFIFGCTVSLIIPFVQVYTLGIEGANFMVPLFAYLITFANGIYCLSLSYLNVILAAGHYRQTQRYFFVSAALNVVISIISVRTWGLVGVAFGTLIAMIYHTAWQAMYNAKYLIENSAKDTIKQFVIDIITMAVGLFAVRFINLGGLSYINWIIMAVKVAVLWSVVVLIMNLVFYRKNLLTIKDKIVRRV